MTTLRTRLRGRLERVPGATTFARLVLETVRACLKYRVTGLASEAAFFMLLSAPPLVLALFGGVGYVGRWLGPDTVAQVVATIQTYAARFLTEQALADVLVPTVQDVLGQGRYDLVSIGFVLALWSGSRALNVFLDTIAIMYGQSGIRGIVGTRALSFSLYALGLLFGVVVLPLMLIGPSLLASWLPERLHLLGLLYWPVVVLAVVAALTTLFHVATPRRAPWWRDVPGAVLALVIWALASFVVRASVDASLGGTSIYGPLSAPIVVLIWLYALAIAVLIGAGLNAATRVVWPLETRQSTRARLVSRVRAALTGRSRPARGVEADPVAQEDRDEQRQFVDPRWVDDERAHDEPAHPERAAS
ncbi:YihY/virulence factor BrkB family protein [Lapillicoccus jejuensis]|uniref:Membrane protein n=1 Tax=Lapillicoccus jejuensis TaxID=402171 RepID=A0A542E5C7_9MICO|nr:YihY/virulence factor BrkB family protein [Lapillicoccus jejuensis]TQJ10541.1 membrane protein [Lapillicoccus jejuensis]